jgi:hypothetical protein
VRFALWLLLIPLAAAGQETPPERASLTGTILECDPQTAAGSGEFSVRAASSQVFRYRFDSATAVDRDSQTIDAARLSPGDRVEVISDQAPGSALLYAAAIRVLTPSSPPRSTMQRRPLTLTGEADRMTLSGGLSFTGVVSLIAGGKLTLRLRDGREQSLAIRQDTSYVADGQRVDASALKPATRVFVEAGRSIFDQVEAYRVVWGGIMQP